MSDPLSNEDFDVFNGVCTNGHALNSNGECRESCVMLEREMAERHADECGTCNHALRRDFVGRYCANVDCSEYGDTVPRL